MQISPPASGLLPRLGFDWFEAKSGLERAISFSDDGLHIWAGVGIQLAVAALSRRGLGSIWPWLVVIVLELANEAVDLWIEVWPNPADQWGEGVKDVLLTLALPTVLMLVARLWPGVLVREHADKP